MLRPHTDVRLAEAFAPPPPSPAVPEPFTIEVRPDRQRVFVTPRGELDLATVGRLSAEIDAVAAAGFGEVVLDLRRLAFMDSTGVRLVLRHTARTDTTVQLIDGAPPIARVFDLAGLRDRLPFISPDAAR
jgi:anti-sigma B factor antagonist